MPDSPFLTLMGAPQSPLLGSMMADPMADPAFGRQQAIDALANAGMALIKASAPRPTPVSFTDILAQGLGGAAGGVRDSTAHAMQNAMMGAQLRNLQFQNAMYPAAMKAMGDTSSYSPYGAAASPAPLTPALAQTATDESGGAPNPLTVTNPTSGAAGLFQFLPATWADTAKNHPELNLPFNPKQATAAQQTAAKQAFDQDNAKALASQGIMPTDASLYTAHRFGAQGATKFLSAPDNAAIASIFDPSWIKANPDLQNKTVGQFKQEVSQRYGGGFQPIGAGTGVAPQVPQGMPAGPQMAQAGPPQAPQATGLPPIPVQAPDPSKYMGLTMLGGPFAAVAAAKMKADQAKYEAAKNLYQMSVQGQTAARENANALVTPSGAPNPAAISAAAAKTQAQESAKVQGHLAAILPAGFEKMTPEELHSKVSPIIAKTADQLASYQLFPSDLGQRPTGTTGPSKAELLAATSYLHPDYDPNLAEQRKEFVRTYMAPDNKGGQVVMSIANASQHLSDAADAYNALRNGKIPLANNLFNALATQNGWDKATSFDTIKQAIGTEIAKVVSGASDNTMTEREANRDILANWNNPDAMNGVFQRFAGLIEKRRNTLYDQAQRYKLPKEYIDQAIGQHGTQALESLPNAILPLRALQALQEGHVTTFGNGQKWMLQNGTPTRVP